MSRPRAFALLEAVVALAILGAAAAVTMAATAAELRGAERVRRALESNALALDRMDRLRTLGRDELVPLADSLRRGAFPPPFDEYRWAASARGIPGEPDLFELHVVVRWGSGSYELDTRVFRAELARFPAGAARQ
ncbi:MAG TPA: hypothetical protein VF046_11475 [Gemmatimonadales bacterium]